MQMRAEKTVILMYNTCTYDQLFQKKFNFFHRLSQDFENFLGNFQKNRVRYVTCSRVRLRTRYNRFLTLAMSFGWVRLGLKLAIPQNWLRGVGRGQIRPLGIRPECPKMVG